VVRPESASEWNEAARLAESLKFLESVVQALRQARQSFVPAFDGAAISTTDQCTAVIAFPDGRTYGMIVTVLKP